MFHKIICFILLIIALLVISKANDPHLVLASTQTNGKTHIHLMRPKGMPVNQSLSDLLIYHGGPIQLSSNIYAFYWEPSGYTVASGYNSLTSRFLDDVAVDSGKTSNIYYDATQYSGITYSVHHALSYTDSTPFPANGCLMPNNYYPVCISDAQVQTEISHMMSRLGIQAGANNTFFLFLPSGVGNCLNDPYPNGDCSYFAYCGYHGFFQNGSQTVKYAVEPYVWDQAQAPCNITGQLSPNNNPEADYEINVMSHEHMEAITDPEISAWYDFGGNEIGDKCAWNFGTGSGPNQIINGHYYEVQQEWSNHSDGCVLSGT